MKTLTLLCLLFLGCEKRVADPELEEVREWLFSVQGQKEVANQLNRGITKMTDQLVPCENWVVKRTFPLKEFETFALYAEEKTGNKGRLLFVQLRLDEGRFIFRRVGYFVTESEFEDIGDPVSMARVRSWRG